MNAENFRNEGKKNSSESLMALMSYTADKAVELANANSVAGDIIDIDGIKVIPISKISAGFAGGGAAIVDVNAKKSKTPAGSGAKVKVTPMSFLVVADGEVRVISIDGSEKDGKGGLISKIMDAVKGFKKSKKEETVETQETIEIEQVK